MARMRATRSVAGTAALGFVMACALPALAQTTAPATDTSPLATQISTLLADPKIEGTHWGISVTQLDGTPIYSLNDAQLFHPESNVKLFTTAAALHLLGPYRRFTTSVVTTKHGPSMYGQTIEDGITLIGTGDANLSSRSFPYTPGTSESPASEDIPPTIQDLADQIAAAGVKTIYGNITGDDTLWPWNRYGEGWNIDDLIWGYGAPVSALSVNDNQVQLVITPGSHQDDPATAAIYPAISFYTLDLYVKTAPHGTATNLSINRTPGSRVVSVRGVIAIGKPDKENIAIDDPAEYAAATLKAALEKNGIRITGNAVALHTADYSVETIRTQIHQPLPNLPVQPIAPMLSKLLTGMGSCMDCSGPLVQHPSPTITDDVIATNKDSLNLHAEILLHQLGKQYAEGGTFAQGARVVRQFAINSGVQPNDFMFYDGSGLSNYDLATPRAFTLLLRFAATQPWGAEWKSSLPVGGVDGTLADRFTKAPLKGSVFAKTGTSSEDRALSGYVVCSSGKTVVFSILATDHLPGSTADRDVIDKIVAAIAAAN